MTRAVEQIVADLIGAGLDQRQTALVLELVVASTRLSGGHPLDVPADAVERRRKWDREYRRNRRLHDRLASTPASTRQSTRQVDGEPMLPSLTSTESQSGIREVRKKDTASVVEGRKRGSRLPDDWSLGDADKKFASEKGLSQADIENEATKFRNYWVNRTDRQASKPRWDLAWQNWILNFKGGNGGLRGSRTLQDDSRSVSRALDRLGEGLKAGTVKFAPRPRLVRDESESDLRLLPKG